MVISSINVVVLQPSVGRIYFAAFSPCKCEIEGALEMYCILVVAVEEGLVSGCCKSKMSVVLWETGTAGGGCTGLLSSGLVLMARVSH